jgi:hypothetical protein
LITHIRISSLKKTSREVGRIHILGQWDIASSVALRSATFPLCQRLRTFGERVYAASTSALRDGM